MIKKQKSNNVKKKVTKTVIPEQKRDLARQVSPWIEDYQDFFLHRSYPVTESFLERIGQELLAYVEDPETELLRIEAFFVKKRIPMRTAQRWVENHPHFKDMYDHAKLILGMRRENGALRKEFAESTIHFTMHMYDPLWEKSCERRSKMRIDEAVAIKMKADELAKNTQQVIILDRLTPQTLKEESV